MENETLRLASDGQVSATAARVYEDFFVPALFARWPGPILARVQPLPGDVIVDVACGTGVLARAFDEVTPGNVTGVDRNTDMLAIATSVSTQIRWLEGLAEELPLPDASCDVAASQFGLMFFEDRVRALREMWRVLKPGGRLAVAVWAALADTPGYAAMVALLRRLFGSAIADELRAPYMLGDQAVLRSLFTEAEIDAVEVEMLPGEVRFPSLDAWLHTDIRGWTLSEQIDDEMFARLCHTAPAALGSFVDAQGEVRFSSPALLATATKS